MILHVQLRISTMNYVDILPLRGSLQTSVSYSSDRTSEERWVNVYRDPIRGVRRSVQGTR